MASPPVPQQAPDFVALFRAESLDALRNVSPCVLLARTRDGVRLRTSVADRTTGHPLVVSPEAVVGVGDYDDSEPLPDPLALDEMFEEGAGGDLLLHMTEESIVFSVVTRDEADDWLFANDAAAYLRATGNVTFAV